MIFFIMKSLQVGDLRAKIKCLNFLQTGEILAILFQLLYAPPTLANCNRMRRLRQQSATACAAYASNLLPYAPPTLAKHTILHGFCYRMRRLRQQIATVCTAYASNLLPHAPPTLANCCRMRRLRQQFATICAAYACNLLPHAPSTLTNSKYKCYSGLFQAMKHVFYDTIYHFYFVLCYILALHVSDCCGNEFLVVYWKFVSILKNRLCQVLSFGMRHPVQPNGRLFGRNKKSKDCG